MAKQKKPSSVQRVTISMTPEDHQAMKALAAALDTTVSELIRDRVLNPFGHLSDLVQMYTEDAARKLSITQDEVFTRAFMGFCARYEAYKRVFGSGLKLPELRFEKPDLEMFHQISSIYAVQMSMLLSLHRENNPDPE